jgi:hypothetical protein
MCGSKIADVAANVIWKILIGSGQMKVKSRHVRASPKRMMFKQRAECGKCRSTLCLMLMLGAQECFAAWRCWRRAPRLVAGEQVRRRSSARLLLDVDDVGKRLAAVVADDDRPALPPAQPPGRQSLRQGMGAIGQKRAIVRLRTRDGVGTHPKRNSGETQSDPKAKYRARPVE